MKTNRNSTGIPPQLQSLLEHIVNGVVSEIENSKKRWTVKLEKEQSVAANASPITGPTTLKKKTPMEEETLDEMTTTSGGGGSSAGTPGYNIPGAWSDGNLERNKKHIEVLGYTLTSQGKEEMKRAGDKLYEHKSNLQESNDGVECPRCGNYSGYVSAKGHGYVEYKCEQCGEEWGFDNFDARDDR